MNESQANSPNRVSGPSWVQLFLHAALAGGVLWGAYELHTQNQRPGPVIAFPKESLAVHVDNIPAVQLTVDLAAVEKKLGELAGAAQTANAAVAQISTELVNLNKKGSEPKPAPDDICRKQATVEKLTKLQDATTELQDLICILFRYVPIKKDGDYMRLPQLCTRTQK